MDEDGDVLIDHGPSHLNLREWLRTWALQNIGNLRNKTISEVLQIFRVVEHRELPCSAEILLGTRHVRSARDMASAKEIIDGNPMHRIYGLQGEFNSYSSWTLVTVSTIAIFCLWEGSSWRQKTVFQGYNYV